MADEKSLEQLIAEAPHELRETYAEIGGIEQLLAPSDNPVARIQAATQYGENMRAQAKMAEENRARERNKAKLTQEAEERAAEAHARDERDRAEAEAQLMARLRREYPPMLDQAWQAMWPQVRADYYRADRERRMRAFENDGNALGEMWGSNF